MIEGINLVKAAERYLGTSYSEMDCQAFPERALKDCGMEINLAGSNAWIREVMKNGAVMTPEECVRQLGKVPPGAFLFILEQDGKEPEKYRGDGIGNASHMGFCTDETADEMMAYCLARISSAKERKKFVEQVSHGNGAIHSSSSRGCVCTSKFSGKTIPNGGWNRVGLWNKIAYDYTGGGGKDPVPEPEPEPKPEPQPEPEMATVGNVPAGNRQDVNLRTRASTISKLIDRVPCGAQVVLLDRGDKWSKVKWKGYTGWMMTKYLITQEEPEDYCTVTIQGISRQEAEAIKAVYPDAEITFG